MGIEFEHYGEERTVNATKGEEALYNKLLEILNYPEHIQLARKSENYVYAVVGVADVCMFKWNSRTHWIILPLINKKKIYLASVDDLELYRDQIIEHYEWSLRWGLTAS